MKTFYKDEEELQFIETLSPNPSVHTVVKYFRNGVPVGEISLSVPAVGKFRTSGSLWDFSK